MRAQTCAIILFVANVANLALAPLLIRGLSDILARHIADPEQSLRYALIVAAFISFWGAYHYAAAARGLKEAQARAAARFDSDSSLAKPQLLRHPKHKV
jgi:hypothetical protein